MLQTVVPGAKIDSLTYEETRELIRSEYRTAVENRVRAEATVRLDATGTGVLDVYTVPVGFEFELRRLNIASDTGYGWAKFIPQGGGTGQSSVVPIEYLRSGESLSRAVPDKYFDSTTPTNETWYLFPHVETWSREQGPYLRNGEILQVAFRAVAFVASVGVQVTAEGLLRKPPARF
jgi:hypothetical protein